jgi:DNA-directed RNA polymerase alpha subunit
LIAGNDKKLEFDFIGLSEAFANTIRRIMIAEVNL